MVAGSTLKTLASIAALLLHVNVTGAAERWTIASETDATNYQEIIVLSLVAENSISDEYATKKVKPVLQFYCAANGDAAISARIDWQRFISSFNTQLTFTFDDQEPLVLTFGVDRTNTITASKRTADAQAIVAKQKEAQKLVVTVTPYSEFPVDARFSVDGLGDALGRLSRRCKPDA